MLLAISFDNNKTIISNIVTAPPHGRELIQGADDKENNRIDIDSIRFD